MSSVAAAIRSPVSLAARAESAILWLLAFSCGIVLVEPSPYELVFALAALFFLARGLRLDISSLGLVVPLALFNIGGLLSLVPMLGEPESVSFILVSAYLGVTAIFFALLMQERAAERLRALKSGYVAAAALASAAGLLGYFDIAGLGSLFTRYERAAGTFKDPNVLGAFVILGLVFVAQDLLLRRRSWLTGLPLFLTIALGGVVLSFSRGAWAHAIGSLGLMLLLTFVLSRRAELRWRIVRLVVPAAMTVALALTALLSIEEVRTMFEARATLSQSYDLGETGRFGNQLRSIPELVEAPNGYGPLRYRFRFGEDPHNVYINAFASYGWLGGLSYVALVVLTVVIGWRTALTPSPLQAHAVAIWSVLFVQILQGFQIDTDHWRHWYLMLGLTWGMYALVRRAASAPARSPRAQADLRAAAPA